MVMKSAESYAHAIILGIIALSPVAIFKKIGPQASSIFAKWFKLAAWAQAEDAYWDPCEECVKNSSDHMLEQVGTDNNDPYWSTNITPTPKWNQTVAEDESLDDIISKIKMVASQKKKVPKLAMKLSPSKGQKMTKKSPTWMQW